MTFPIGMKPLLWFLIPFSWVYALIVVLRNKAFDLGLLKVSHVGVPVISVGNITVGGTGKTPLVEYITRHCLSRNKRVAVVSRGYKRTSRGVVVVSNGDQLLVDADGGGDEPVQIARKFPGVPVVVAERRVEAIAAAVDELRAEVILLDDGFQHRYVAREVDIVVVDSKNGLSPGFTLPAGPLREPRGAIARADLVALSHAGSAEPGRIGLERWFDGAMVSYRYKTEQIRRAYDHLPCPFASLKGVPALLFSGIGNHRAFVEETSSLGILVVDDVKFQDHHLYDVNDIERVLETMRRSGASIGITTEKDVVRLNAHRDIMESLLRDHPIYYTTISVEMVRGEDILHSMIDRCLERATS